MNLSSTLFLSASYALLLVHLQVAQAVRGSFWCGTAITEIIGIIFGSISITAAIWVLTLIMRGALSLMARKQGFMELLTLLSGVCATLLTWTVLSLATGAVSPHYR